MALAMGVLRLSRCRSCANEKRHTRMTCQIGGIFAGEICLAEGPPSLGPSLPLPVSARTLTWVCPGVLVTAHLLCEATQ